MMKKNESGRKFAQKRSEMEKSCHLVARMKKNSFFFFFCSRHSITSVKKAVLNGLARVNIITMNFLISAWVQNHIAYKQLRAKWQCQHNMHCTELGQPMIRDHGLHIAIITAHSQCEFHIRPKKMKWNRIKMEWNKFAQNIERKHWTVTRIINEIHQQK